MAGSDTVDCRLCRTYASAIMIAPQRITVSVGLRNQPAYLRALKPSYYGVLQQMNGNMAEY